MVSFTLALGVVSCYERLESQGAQGNETITKQGPLGSEEVFAACRHRQIMCPTYSATPNLWTEEMWLVPLAA